MLDIETILQSTDDLRTSASNVPRRGHKRPSSSFTRSASPLGMSSRSLSRPRSSVSSPTIPMSASFASTITPAHIYDLPPVPPIPPTYGAEVPQQPLQNLVGEVERGRSTISRSNSLASVPEKPLPVEPQSPPQPTRNPSNKGRTLQKPKPANVS